VNTDEITQSKAQKATGFGTPRLLQTDGVTKRFGGITAVDDVDFSIEKGELQCLIGPNGAGKSTLLNLLCGHHQPTEGEIYYDGEVITDFEPYERARRGIAMKFQTPSVYEPFEVRENMQIALQRLGQDTDTQIEESLALFGLDDVADRAVKDLSHGRQQLLEIAMVVSLKPDLLLLDEPVAGMSIEETNEIVEVLERLKNPDSPDDRMSFIVIEHDMDFVEKIADAVTVLHQGRLFKRGSIQEVKNDPGVKEIYLGEAES